MTANGWFRQLTCDNYLSEVAREQCIRASKTFICCTIRTQSPSVDKGRSAFFPRFSHLSLCRLRFSVGLVKGRHGCRRARGGRPPQRGSELSERSLGGSF